MLGDTLIHSVLQTLPGLNYEEINAYIQMFRVVFVRVEAGLLAPLTLVGSVLKSFSVFIFLFYLISFCSDQKKSFFAQKLVTFTGAGK